jgi:hypothetical protein
MAKGAQKQAQKLFGNEADFTGVERGRGKDDRSQIFPFLTNELDNPQGFGKDALSQMLTQGGEAVSGATGAAGEAANLNASRTGNTAAVPGIIDSTARNAMRQQSNNALDVNIQDAMLKQKQQQAGATGLEGLYGADISSALKSMGLENDTLGEWTKADQATQDAFNNWGKLAIGGSLAGASIQRGG